MQKPSKVVKYSQTGTYSTTKDGEAVIISSWYNFAGDTYTIIPDPEEPDHGSGEEGEDSGGETEETIGSVAELIQNYNDEVYQALNASLLDDAGRRIYGRSFKAENLVGMKWDLGTSNTISEIKLISTYKLTSQDNEFTIATIKLTSPINVENLEKDNILNQVQSLANISECNRDYTFTYGINALNGHEELYKAIFAACGHELTAGSTILFSDMGHILDSTLNEAHGFKIAEITNDKVQEYTVRVKEASSDEGYINNLEKENGFIQTSQQSQTLSGNFVKEMAQKENKNLQQLKI